MKHLKDILLTAVFLLTALWSAGCFLEQSVTSNESEKARIAGLVIQNESGATVELVQGRTVMSTEIDPSDGYFEISDITPGTYRLVITAKGYDEFQTQIQVEEGYSYGCGLVVLALKNNKFDDTIPSIYDHYPVDNAEVIYLPPDKYNAGSSPLYVSISFDRAMDRMSVEKAFSIEPAVDGGYFSWFQNTRQFNLSNTQYEWTGNTYKTTDALLVTAADMEQPPAQITTYSTMKSFTYYFPRSGCFTDTTYTITIGKGAVDTAGTPLDTVLEFTFKTIQSAVSYDDVQMIPHDGEDWVPLLSPQGIKLTFPRRMRESSVENHVRVNLAPDAIFIWQDYNVVNIYTGGSFFPDTIYKVIIDAETKDIDGQLLGEKQVLKFQTEPLRVQSTSPMRGSFGVNPDVDIILTFNTYMDRQSFKPLISLKSFDGEAVQGTVTYRFHVNYPSSYSPDTTYYLNQIAFMPDAKLQTNTAYTLYLEAGGEDLFGNQMKSDFKLDFVTMP